MAKLIYIASSAHSGSTLLEMLLSSHRHICGLGEMQMLANEKHRHKFLDRKGRIRCSCEQVLTECCVWSKYLDFLDTDPSAAFDVCYGTLINLVYKELGNDTIIVDSSKYLAPLMQVLDSLESDNSRYPGLTVDDVLVIHLVKDVRTFVTSMKHRHDLLRLRDKGKLLGHFNHWYQSNKRMAAFLCERSVRHIRISYEALCFHTEAVLSGLCEEIGISFSPDMLDISQSHAHIGTGNPMRNHQIKSQQIIYDSRWFYETDIQLLYHLLPRIRCSNEELMGQSRMFDPDSRLFEPKASFMIPPPAQGQGPSS